MNIWKNWLFLCQWLLIYSESSLKLCFDIKNIDFLNRLQNFIQKRLWLKKSPSQLKCILRNGLKFKINLKIHKISICSQKTYFFNILSTIFCHNFLPFYFKTPFNFVTPKQENLRQVLSILFWLNVNLTARQSWVFISIIFQTNWQFKMVFFRQFAFKFENLSMKVENAQLQNIICIMFAKKKV